MVAVYSRLAGYEDTNDAERLAQDPAMRVIVGWQGTDKQAASTNTMSRFETEVLAEEENLNGLARLNVEWVDRAMAQTSHQRVILDMDSSESPVHGQQEGVAYNGHFESVCYHPLFLCFARATSTALSGGGSSGASREAIPGERSPAAVPGRCCLCQARGVRVPGVKGHWLRYAASGQRGITRKQPAPTEAARGQAA